MTSGQKTFLRLMFFVASFFVMTSAPFFVFVILLFLGFVFFHFFVEGMLLALMYDLFFGVATPAYFDISIATFLLAVVMFLIIYFVKKFTSLSSYEI